ncbi:MAG TPA: prolyl oligopeptidase family serine peptidase [Steroidobacteraceae bacterium]|nr:prolyl oligopeptidase family serine peptidase [Steroidobacteraceae bacterium]
MVKTAGVLCATLVALLAGCGSSSRTSTVATSTDRGTLIYNPPARLASLDAPTLTEELGATTSGQQLLELAGPPICGVDFYYLQYYTVGAKNETATASGALMLPTGTEAPCTGPRPIVLYAHATNAEKTYNIANIADSSNPAYTESALVAAVFAAQGYIVVAPNYAGYDVSSLPYHPFLNGDQQPKDMADALAAARTALPNTFTPSTSDNGQLFVTGYSEGGYVAMATVKAMTAAGQTVTASAGLSGPYAIEALVDAVFLGSVDVGSTEFTPLLITSYQEAYGNLYTEPTDIYEPQYAPNMFELLPSTTPLDTLYANGTLPETALFSNSTPVIPGNPQLTALLAIPSNPVFAVGFGTPNLIANDYRVSYAADALTNPDGAVLAPPSVALAANPQNTLRIALKTNDIRNGAFWAPKGPMLMCGGDQDPTVFFGVDTGTMATYWAHVPAGLITVLDVNATPTANDPFAPLQLAFQQDIASILATSGETGVVASYHTTVAPFCTVAARSFFSHF